MRCLVTGAAGFIGSSLCDRLLTLGHEVLGVDCFTDYYSRSVKESNIAEARANPRFEFVDADLLNINLVGLLDGIDWVFHQAGQPGVRGSWGHNFEVYLRNNVLVTQRLLEAAVKSTLSRFVYASSSSVYGNSPELPLKETSKPQPVSPYGVTKLAAEHLAYLYYANYGVPTVSIRYFTVYGPRQRPDMGFHKFIKAALNGEEIMIYGDGEQTRDFTYISDAVAANIQAADSKNVVGGVFNIGGGSCISMNAVLDILRELAGDIRVKYSQDQKGDVLHTMSDTTTAREVLGYTPEFAIREGLVKQVNWMKG